MQLDRIVQFFTERDSSSPYQGKYVQKTSFGHFLPTPLFCAFKFFSYCIDHGILDISKPVVDLGCGDGRIIALLQGVFEIEAYGIEGDSKLVKRAKHNLDQLQIKSRIFEGDFLDDGSYEKPFHEYKQFFHFKDNHQEIAEKIASQSPNSTLLLFDWNPRQDITANLQHKVTLSTTNDLQTEVNVNKLENDSKDDYYLHILKNVDFRSSQYTKKRKKPRERHKVGVGRELT